MAADDGASRADTLRVGLLPAELQLDPGDTFTTEITILDEGLPFNAYDAVVAYDPERLTFLQADPVSDQEGPLMTEACPTRFHIFTIAPDSTTLTVNHSLLCAGVSVTGPGVVYRLEFRCKSVEGTTELRLLDGAGQTRFYNDGLFVTPLVTEDARLVIGQPLTVPSDLPDARLRLDAAPNPFNPRTVFSFDLPARQHATLTIYAVDGRLVQAIASGVLDSGRHTYTWDGCDRHGRTMPSGGYTALLETGNRSEKCSVTLIK